MEKEIHFPNAWQIVAAIPEGYVTTYGDVAKLARIARAAPPNWAVLLKRLTEGAYPGTGWLIAAQFRLTGPDLQRQRRHYWQKV